MNKIIKYSFVEMLRSKWLIFYTIFFLVTTSSLLYLSNDLTKAIVSLMDVTIIIIPLISSILGTMFQYNSREFSELLLAQPIKRSAVFVGQYLGVALSLSLSFFIGMAVPFLVYGIHVSTEVWNFALLLFNGVALTFIFVVISFLIAVYNKDKIKGFGLMILIWLFMAVIYDGLVLIILANFSEYPLEKPAIAMSMANPIDLSRILMMLKLDISAMMGFTGAVFAKFFGSTFGMFLSAASIMIWWFIPFWLYLRKVKRMDI